MICTNYWSEYFRVKTSRIVSKFMMYASIAAPIYASWGIDADSYHENYLMLISKQLSMEEKV